MNNLKKIGLTALAGSLVATSVFAGAMDVTGSAGITYAGQDKKTSNNTWSMSDEITFTGSGEMDNGWNVTVSMQLDNNANGATSGNNMDNRSVKIDMGDAGAMTFYGHGADSAFSMKDDVTPTAYGESWDVIGVTTGGAAAKFGSIGGTTSENMFGYTNGSMVEGLTFNASYSPSNATQNEGATAFGVEYSGFDGLVAGFAVDENGGTGTNGIYYETMYVKYTYGPVTAGIQSSEQDADGTTNDDEFDAMGVTYAISEDLSIGYNTSTYNDGNTVTDQESTNYSFSYTMGSMTIGGAMVSMDNIGGTTNAIDDTEGFELDVGFAF